MLGFREYLQKDPPPATEQEVIAHYLSNQKLTDMVKLTERSIAEIYRILHKNQVKPNRLRMNYQGVIDFASAGLNLEQIADLTGYSERQIRRILHDRQ